MPHASPPAVEPEEDAVEVAATTGWRTPDFEEQPSFAELGYWDDDGDEFHAPAADS